MLVAAAEALAVVGRVVWLLLAFIFVAVIVNGSRGAGGGVGAGAGARRESKLTVVERVNGHRA